MVSWSSGKDSAWALHTLRQQPDRYEVRGIFTTVTPTFDRVSIQATPRAVLRLQAERLRLPLYEIPIPYPCSNQEYEAAMGAFLERIRALGDDHTVRHLVFGDLFLEDIRQYREQNLRGTGFQPLFPLFGADTAALAQDMIAAGLRAIVTVVNPQQLSPRFAGRSFDQQLLDELPPTADPLGENGEYHTCVIDGPMFSRPIAAVAGEIVEREIRAAASEQDRYGNPTYVYADVVLKEPLIGASASQGKERMVWDRAADPSTLPNIGPRTAAWLRECGVTTASDLLDADAVTLYLRLKARRPREVTLVALWAIVGAQLGLDWRQLPPALKEDLRAKLRVEARRSAPPPTHPARIL